MNKLTLVLGIGTLLAGCGETQVSKQESNEEKESRDGMVITWVPKSDAGSESTLGALAKKSDQKVKLHKRQTVAPVQEIRRGTANSDISDRVDMVDEDALVIALSDIQPIVDGSSGVVHDIDSAAFGLDNGVSAMKSSRVDSFTLGSGQGLAARSSLGVVVPRQVHAGLDRGRFERGNGVPRPFIHNEENSNEEYDRIHENPFFAG